MADKDLTDALYRAKEKRQNATTKTAARKSDSSAALPYRRRSFDTFYAFGVMFLAMAIGLQLAAIFIYN